MVQETIFAKSCENSVFAGNSESEVLLIAEKESSSEIAKQLCQELNIVETQKTY